MPPRPGYWFHVKPRSVRGWGQAEEHSARNAPAPNRLGSSRIAHHSYREHVFLVASLPSRSQGSVPSRTEALELKGYGCHRRGLTVSERRIVSAIASASITTLPSHSRRVSRETRPDDHDRGDMENRSTTIGHVVVNESPQHRSPCSLVCGNPVRRLSRDLTRRTGAQHPQC